MGGGGSAPAPQPIAVPSAADEEAAEERARLYGLLRSRRGARGLAFGPRRRTSLLSLTNPAAKTPAGALADLGFDWAGGGSGGTGASEGGGGGFGGGEMGGGLSGGGE